MWWCVCTQQYHGTATGTGNYSMSCRAYSAATAGAMAAGYRHRSAVADVGGGGTINYGETAPMFCSTVESSDLLGPRGVYFGPLHGYSAYGACGADSGGGYLFPTTMIVDGGGASGDVTSRNLTSCIGDKRWFGDERHFVAPPPTAQSSSSAALVELKDFVCRGGERLMQTGGEYSRFSLPGTRPDQPNAHWPPRVDELSDTSTAETPRTSTTTTRSSCLYSDVDRKAAAIPGIAKSESSQNDGGASTKTNAGLCGGVAPSGTLTCDKTKTTSSGNHRANHFTGLHSSALTIESNLTHAQKYWTQLYTGQLWFLRLSFSWFSLQQLQRCVLLKSKRTSHQSSKQTDIA